MGTTPANSINCAGASGLVNFDGTATFSTTALTQYYVVSGASSNTVNNIAPSTSGYVLTSNGASAQPTFQAAVFTKMPWTDEGTNFNAAVQNGYFITATATATLPPSPSQGDVISFIVDSVSGILTITANTSQFIRIGKQITLTAGTVASNFNGDALTLVYRSSDATWKALDEIGTWTVTTS